MRLTEFSEQMTEQFGTVRADSMLVDHALIDFGGRTPAQALDDGVEPREVWLALCRDFDVPRERW
ncbi:DUF3046 domain-containing protein [Jongsikchunia kroppenstedtii]|uniref:DUF3046 domain-containing protein n=1 Tax=Jongsikchunia kroppenstedtii TaxID=1121721 RepID=UPI0003744474|nr:DUF3046 domain-containing protein [Jongsikchunia kroppenstedtii]